MAGVVDAFDLAHLSMRLVVQEAGQRSAKGPSLVGAVERMPAPGASKRFHVGCSVSREHRQDFDEGALVLVPGVQL